MVKYQKMVVIFVDILGTKNNEAFENKYLIHRLFHGEIKTNEERNMSHVIYDRKVFSFSDCAYFVYYYKDGIEEHRKNDMKLLQIAMYNTTISLLRILNAGYLVRGGVAFGDTYFDELGFFGPAVEEAYSLESNYADVPIIALNPELGKKFCEWENVENDDDVINLLMTSRPSLVEKKDDKYFVNVFYQLEAFTPSLQLESEIVELEAIKNTLFDIIAKDKIKYQDIIRLDKKKKSSIYEKLDWFEKYLLLKHNRLKSDLVQGAFSMVYKQN